MAAETAAVTMENKPVRLHISGLPNKITAQDVGDCVRSFGTVRAVEIVPNQFEGGCRGYAFVDTDMTDAALKHCMSALNGATWKGGKLQVARAKPSFAERLAARPTRGIPDDGVTVKMRRKRIRHAANQSLVTDKNVDERPGWRRGRYGRAIAVLNLRRLTGKLLAVDPSHYKNSLEKLFGSVKPKPLGKLTWTIAEFDGGECKDLWTEKTELADDASDTDSAPLTDEPMGDIKDDSDETLSSDEEMVNMDEAALDTCMDSQDCMMENGKPAFVDETRAETISDLVPELGPDLASSPGPLTSTPGTEATDTERKTNEDGGMVLNATQGDKSDRSVEDLVAEEVIEDTELLEADTPFKVNVSWGDLFSAAPSSGGFSLNLAGLPATANAASPFNSRPSSAAASKPDPSSRDKTTHSPAAPAKDTKKAPANFAGIFSDLGSVTADTAIRFGMLQSDRERVLEAWREERHDLRQDFKARHTAAKRQARKKRTTGNAQDAAPTDK